MLLLYCGILDLKINQQHGALTSHRTLTPLIVKTFPRHLRASTDRDRAVDPHSTSTSITSSIIVPGRRRSALKLKNFLGWPLRTSMRTLFSAFQLQGLFLLILIVLPQSIPSNLGGSFFPCLRHFLSSTMSLSFFHPSAVVISTILNVAILESIPPPPPRGNFEYLFVVRWIADILASHTQSPPRACSSGTLVLFFSPSCCTVNRHSVWRQRQRKQLL